MPKNPPIPRPSTLSIGFLIAGFVLIVSASAVELRAQVLTGPGSTVLDALQDEESLKASAPEAQRNIAGHIALGMLFILIGIGMHAVLVLQRKDRPAVVPVHAARGTRKHTVPVIERLKRSRELILVERVIRF